MTSIKAINFKTPTILFILFIFLTPSPAFNQIYGCADAYANNYNPSATVNDGTCTYNDTYYIPPVIVERITDSLKESSGLQWARNGLWSFNDKGGAADLYRIDTVGNTVLQTVHLTGATNVDWEELTFDGTYFYIGDFGNNLDGARTDLKIYKFPISAIPDYKTTPDVSIPSEQIKVINFTYSDQDPNPVAVPLDSTKFDCEAMIVSGGKIHLFTKDWIDFTSTHYVINSTLGGSYVASPVETLKTGYLVTSASKSPGQEVVVLLGYLDGGFGNHYMHLLSGYSDGKYFNGNKRKINLPGASEMGQAEGITFRKDGYGYISNERFNTTIGASAITVDQKLRSFGTGSFAPSIILALSLKDFSVTKINASHKITWNFNSPVDYMEIQHGIDGLHFNTLKSYNKSTNGVFYNMPGTGINYYRIAWKQNSGEYQYSGIVRIKNEEYNGLKRFLLRSNGQLSFMLNGSEDESFAFRLLSLDGKELSQIPERSYKSGLNKITFPSVRRPMNAVVIVAGYGNKQIITRLVRVVR